MDYVVQDSCQDQEKLLTDNETITTKTGHSY